MKILYGTRTGSPQYMEEILTEHEKRFEEAISWAMKNGFDHFRIAEIDENAPDFTKSVLHRKHDTKTA
ncbi:MAG: hypothetical protein WC346_11665 [Methanogenium sp.]|jgi:SpoVK/Ycf46/Vps4 family AAA+-type ATPase